MTTPPAFGAVLAVHARSTPDRPAVIYDGKAVTWRQLDQHVGHRAQILAQAGIGQDDLVAIAMANAAEHHEWTFAAWRLGATPCVLPSKLPVQEMADLVALTDARVIISETSVPDDRAVRLNPTSSVGDDGAMTFDERAPRYWKAVASGGSTGKPKVIVDHAAGRLDATIQGLLDTVRMPKGGAILNPGPLYHNGPFLFSNLALLAGSTVIGMARFDAETCLRLIEAHRIEWVCLVPTMMHRIWSLPVEVRESYDLSPLRCVWHMAAACPVWLKQAWIDWLGPDRIFEVYAGTEGLGSAIGGVEWMARPGSVGRLPPEAAIYRSNGNLCEPGEVGEIFLPAAAADKFHYLGAETRRNAAGQITLGDLGYIDADRYLFLADRRTDLIIRGGANIYPAEVEAVLDEHPGVGSSVVIGLASDEYGQRTHAIVQAVQMSLTASDLDAFARSRLARFKCPESYEFVTTPLRDDAGKVRRSALRDERESLQRSGARFQTIP